MVVIKICLSDYTIPTGHLLSLAAEYYGQPLTNDKENNSMEFGFEHKEFNESELAKGFRKTLDTGFKAK